MIKKIKVEQLKSGMFVQDLNCSWMHHPFLSNSIQIQNEKTIEKIISAGIHDVYIDTDKGLDVVDALTLEEARQETQQEITRAVEPERKVREEVSVQHELVRAKKVKREAMQTVQNLMEDIRFGKPIEVERVNHVVENMVGSILRNQDALTSLSRIKKVDEYTFMHSVSVGVLMISFGKHLGCDVNVLRDVGVGAMLHDIGKMKVPLEILNSTGRLTEAELETMREHVKFTRTLLEQTHGISETSLALASQHHERIDGTGYPDHLKGDDISVFGQAIAIVDTYDAMTSQRCYQSKSQPTEVLGKLFEWDTVYNRDLVQQFIRCMGIYPVGTLVRLESGLLGVVLRHGEKSLIHPAVRIVYDTKSDRHIMPYDVVLSSCGRDRVESYEIPDKWNIQPEMYL